MSGPNFSENWFQGLVTCVTHFLLLAPAIYIVILALGLNHSLFLWHPTCMAVGCGLLMTEAILGISGDALLASVFSRTNRIKLHWVLHGLGLSLLIVGFATVVENKNRNGFNHFTSDHGKLGLSSFIISLFVGICGFFTLFSGLISERLSLASVKLLHACLGVICMILVIVTLITGTYRGWWPGSVTGRGLTVAAYIIGGVLVLFKPFYNAAFRIRGLFN